jgi:uncharacterized protein with NAD-binding domain and iron-sulfur cluster
MATAMRAVPEVAVVGGGFAGLSCAMNLCKRGVKVGYKYIIYEPLM